MIEKLYFFYREYGNIMFKIMFLVCLFGTSASIWQVMIVALIANLLVTAVPIGGGTISEMMILSMMGYPVAALPILTMVATIIDAPATVLNSVGDSVASMMVAKLISGLPGITSICAHANLTVMFS